MRSLRSNKYRGHLWTIVSSQSRNLSLPQRGSASCCAMNVANAGLVLRRDVYDARVSENAETKGVYRER